MKKDNKQWQKPELIALVRSKPEETVLMGCKSCTNPPSSGPSRGSSNCVTGPQPSCYNCYSS